MRNLNFEVVFSFGPAITPIMRKIGNASLFALAGVLLSGHPCQAISPASDGPNPNSADHYRAIVDRNVFGLKAPPPPPDPEANKPPPPKITPTGITTILGNKRALFKVQLPARPPEPAKEQSYILTVGQREGQIEVLEIDEIAGSIKFNNYGSIVTLTLEKDGAKPPNTPPAAVPPPGAQPATAGYAPPGANPQGIPGGSSITTIGGAGAGLKSIPTRTLRLPGSSVPGGAPAVGINPQAANQENLSREEQVILMELERERTRDQVSKGVLPPLPPTPISPGGKVAPPAPQ